MTRHGTRDKIAAYLRARPGRWVSMLRLIALVPARYRQAISENRAAGMHIENEKRVSKGRIVSFYRYEPKDAA